jgi:ABC-2 type transport system permease protein/lipopolysaccharide transport system permease protein
MINTAAAVFIDAGPFISSCNLPLLFYALKAVTAQTLTFLQSLIAVLVIPMVYGTVPSASSLVWTPFVISLIVLNGLFTCMWLGLLSARFRDIRVGINTALQVLFFLSPVFWSPEQISERHWIVSINPLGWFIETFRRPLLGISIEIGFVLGMLSLTLLNLAMALFVLEKNRQKLSYWI